METRDQVKKQVPNPTGKGGFQDRPEDRNKGTWDSKNSISFQYNRMLNMSEADFEELVKQPKTDRTMAQRLAFNRIKAADKSLPDMKEITDRVEGKPQVFVDATTNGKDLPSPIISLNTDVQ